MNRIELFANQALSDIIEKELNALNNQHYTILRDCAGKGNKGFALGTDVWPEHNVVFIIYADEKNSLEIKTFLLTLKESFPIIGLCSFITADYRELV